MDSIFKKEVLIPLMSLGVFLLAVILFKCYESDSRERYLKNYAYNYAIVRNKSSFSNGGRWLYLNHKVKGMEYRADGISARSVDLKINCFNKLEIGDTVFIKYAIENPDIVMIETCYWNRKTQIINIR